MPTIYESFWEAVDPDHVGSGREVFENVHVPAPSNNTEKFEPPNFLLRTPESKWLSIAKDALEQHKSTLDQENTCLAPWESNMPLKTKSAVVNRSTIYLNNPVHIALHAAQNHSVTCYMRSEATLGTTPESEARADMAYMRDGRTYAVLEYKKPGAVSERCAREDFERGVPKNPEMFADWMVSGERRFMPSVSGADDARFLLQQAVHYSSFETRFVAFFDWNALVLLVFPPFQGLSYAYITEVTDNRKFRPALLGFLLFAYRHNLKKHDNSDLSGGLKEIQPDVLPFYGQAYRRRMAEEDKRNRGNQGPRGPTSYLEIGPHLQEPLAGSQYSRGGGRNGNNCAPPVPKRYDDAEIFSVNGYQNAPPPDGYHWDAAATGPSLESHLQEDRSRYQQNSDRYVADDQSARDGPFQNHHANSDPDTCAATSSAYANKPNLDVVFTRIPRPGTGREQGSRQEDSKAPGRILATQHEGPGGRVVNTQTREVDRGAGRPPPVPPKGPGAFADGAELYGASRYNYYGDGGNYANGTPEHFGAHTGNSWPPYGGPLRSQTYTAGSTRSVDRDELARKPTKGKNGKKFMGMF